MTAVAAAATARRELGVWTCTALVVGNTLGLGVFLLPRDLAPFGFAAVWAWLLVGCGCLVLARVLGALARALPDANGPYGYVQRTLGDAPAVATTWCYWVSLWITNATLAVGIVSYLRPQLPAGTSALVVESACVWLPVAVNLCGVRTGGRVQVVTTVLKLVPIAVVVAVGAWLLAGGGGGGPVPRHPVESTHGVQPVLAAAAIALFALLGIESATVPAARVRDPARTLPRATFVGTVLCALLCAAASSVPLLVLPQAELAHSDAPFVATLDACFGAGSGTWVAAFVAISGLGAINGWTLLAGELTRTLATDGMLPRALAHTNRFDAPAVALLLVGALGQALVLASHAGPDANAFLFLSRLVTAANLPLYLFCALALFVVAPGAGQRVLAVGGAGIVALAFVGMGGAASGYAAALVASGLLPFVLRRGARHRER